MRFLYITLLLISFYSYSQDTLSIYIQEKSTEYFNNKEWKKLKEITDLAFENDINNYETQLMLAMVYFNQKKYNLAYKEFLDAKKISNNNEVNKYLYLSYIYGEHFAEAEVLKRTLDSTLINELNTVLRKSNQNIYFRFGIRVNNDFDRLKNITVNTSQDYILLNNVNNVFTYYADASVNIHQTPFHSSNFNIKSSYEPQTIIFNKNDTIKEYSSSGKFTQITLNYSYSSIRRSIYFDLSLAGGSEGLFYIHEPFTKDEHYTYDNRSVFIGSSLNIGLGYNQKTTYFDYGINISSINLATLFQFGGVINIYPKANKNLIFSFQTNYLIKNNSLVNPPSYLNNFDNHFVTKVGIHSAINKIFSFDLSAYFGKLDLYTERSIFKNFGVKGNVTSLYSGQININITKRFKVYLLYSYIKRMQQFRVIYKSQYYSGNSNDISHYETEITNQDFSIGLKLFF